MTFKHIYRRFKEFGGLRLLGPYLRMGVFPVALRSILKGRSMKQVYADMSGRINPWLSERYIKGAVPVARPEGAPAAAPVRKVWTCWLQGEAAMPAVARSCMASISQALPDYELIILSEENWSDYVSLPAHVVEKRRKGLIHSAMFTDMLRLALLVEHGGVWMDATVLCTGCRPGSELSLKMRDALESDLFMPRYRRTSIGSWLIAARPQNPMLIHMRDLMFEYWKDFNCSVQYYLIHFLFAGLSPLYPDIISAMPVIKSNDCIQLGRRIDEAFDQQWWDELVSSVPFHKLSYRGIEKAEACPQSYCSYIENKYVYGR